MAENKSCSLGGRDLVCIEAAHVLDSCRDRDCFEDVGVYLTDFGQEIIEHTGNVRVKCAEISEACITVDPVQFNRGFFSVNVRLFVNVRFEACVGGRNQEFDGVTALEKKVILYGGECGVNTFRSGTCDNICESSPGTHDSGIPTATVEVASPVVLDAHIAEVKDYNCNCCCCCCIDEIPDSAYRNIGAPLSRSGSDRILVISLGVFSVVRITRPAQYLVNATEYSVPDKECNCGEDKDPCCLFRTMEFPTEEFSCGSGVNGLYNGSRDRNCGCKNDNRY
ncbi:MAG: hypothetical protein IJZ89_00370 [Clostridia bacterium]|nr:hypothetical protein [Clostridia bacterium]